MVRSCIIHPIASIGCAVPLSHNLDRSRRALDAPIWARVICGCLQTRCGATCSGHSTAQAPANIALADASGSADIIADILQAAAVPGDCAAAAEGNTPARPAQSQQARCPEAGLLAQGADAAATVFVTEVSPKQSKRKTPGSS